MRTLLCSLALAALLAPHGRADVLKVAPTGGTHTDLQQAVDDALDGDIIVVAQEYSSSADPAALVIIDGKSLTLVSDGPQRRTIPSTSVRNLPGTGQVVLRNLEMVASTLWVFLGAPLAVSDCAGAVFVEDCLVQGNESFFGPVAGGPAVQVSNSQKVAFARCELAAGDGSSTMNQPPFVVWDPAPGGRAVVVTGSRVDFQSCQIAGGHGGHDGLFGDPGMPGGQGLLMDEAQVWLTGCDVTGGNSGFGEPHGAPAAAVRMVGASSGLRTLDTSLAGGAGQKGEPAAPGLEQLDGTTLDWAGAAITLTMDAPVRPGDASTIAVDGPAGTLFGFFTSFGLGFLPKTNLHGVVLGDLATFGGPLFINSLPASGHFELPFVVPAIGLDGFLKVDQVISSQAGAGLVLSNASAYIQVENGF